MTILAGMSQSSVDATIATYNALSLLSEVETCNLQANPVTYGSVICSCRASAHPEILPPLLDCLAAAYRLLTPKN